MADVKIPKIIWQTYKTHEIPSKWIPSPESLKTHHPSWSYHFVTDEDIRKFVEQEYPQYLNLYDRVGAEIKHICRVDMVRCLLLHKYGGFYIDLDYKALKAFDPLFVGDADIYVFKTPNMGNSYTNSFMASKPKVEFWIKCIELIQYRLDNCPWYIFGDLRVLWTTGPGLLTSVLEKYNQPYMTIPSKLGHPCTICDHYFNRVCSDSDSYVEELPGSSWTSPSTQIFYFTVCQWYDILLLVLIMLTIVILYLLFSKTFSSISYSGTSSDAVNKYSKGSSDTVNKYSKGSSVT